MCLITREKDVKFNYILVELQSESKHCESSKEMIIIVTVQLRMYSVQCTILAIAYIISNVILKIITKIIITFLLSLLKTLEIEGSD